MLTKQVIIDGINVRYYQSNHLDTNGALVFLHGWGSEALHLQTIFRDRTNFIAIDLPGFGGSDRPRGAWGVGEYASFLKELLVKLGIQNPVLVGHSFGGSIIIKYLAGGGTSPKAILISPAGLRKKGGRVVFYRALAKIFKVPFMLPGAQPLAKKIRPLFYRLIDSNDYIEAGPMIETYRKVVAEDLCADMAKIRAKTALIWGENDKATPLSQGRRTCDMIPGATLRIINNAGHFCFVDQPEVFQRVFLSELNADN